MVKSLQFSQCSVCKQSEDRFIVKVRVSDSSTARLYFEHFIFKLPNEEVTCLYVMLRLFICNDRKLDEKSSCRHISMLMNSICLIVQPILEARATTVWPDKNYRLVRIPPEVRSKFVQFLLHDESN